MSKKLNDAMTEKEMARMVKSQIEYNKLYGNTGFISNGRDGIQVRYEAFIKTFDKYDKENRDDGSFKVSADGMGVRFFAIYLPEGWGLK